MHPYLIAAVIGIVLGLLLSWHFCRGIDPDDLNEPTFGQDDDAERKP